MIDTLTPRQRMTALLSGQPLDRLPCVPLIMNHAARVAGVPVRQYVEDPTVMAAAHIAAYRRYRHDLIGIFADTCILSEVLGSKLKYFDDDVPRLDVPLVGDPADMARLPSTIDVRSAGRLPVYLEAARQCVAEIGDEVLISCCYPAPFSTAAGLRGTDQLARDLYKNPAMVHQLLERSLKVACDFADAVVEVGAIPVIVDPVASGSVISRKAFETFVLPTLSRLMAHIKSLGMPAVLHICGRSETIIEAMADSGATVLSVDVIDLSRARQLVGSRVCLMGNVRASETLLCGSAGDVRAEARACVKACGDSPGGFILATGCEVPIEAPPQNVEALMAAARAFGGR